MRRNMENIFIDFLPPWVETGLQPAFYDKESGTVLQQTARMYAKVNELIGRINGQNTTIQEYITKFNELHDYVYDYFDNLDVQEEINNKLDDMVDDGTLETLINQEILTDVRNQIGMSLIALGLVGDGITDEHEALQAAFDTYDRIYVDPGYVFYSSEPITLKDNQTVCGKGKLKCRLEAKGSIGATLNFSQLTKNSATFTSPINVGDIIYVYYLDENSTSSNHRQITRINTASGKFNNVLRNYDNDYTIKRITTKRNITIKDIALEGNLICEYCYNLVIDNINHQSGTTRMWYCYDCKLKNSKINQGGDQYIDVACGSSNIRIEDLEITNGGSVSDNAALKIDEVFYSDINNINFGTPDRTSPYTGAFSALMIDGNFQEQGYTKNPSYGINVDNLNIADGFTYAIYLTIAQHININNVECSGCTINVQSYSEHCSFNQIHCNKFMTQSYDIQDIDVSNSTIDDISEGTVFSTKYTACVIGNVTFKARANNNRFTSCVIGSVGNAYVTADSAWKNTMIGCEIKESCNISGQRDGIFDLIIHCSTALREVHDCFVKLNIIGNVGNDASNIAIMSTNTNNIIEYMIASGMQTATPLSVEASGDIGRYNVIRTTNLTNCSTPDLNFSNAILKANNVPNSSDVKKHYKGEIIFTTVPTPGGNIGWVCTTTGTPGTWKAFGTIAS